MKVISRILMVVAAPVIALELAGYAARPFVYHVRRGFNEGTPVTLLVFAAVFLFILVCTLVVGNVLITKYVRYWNSK